MANFPISQGDCSKDHSQHWRERLGRGETVEHSCNGFSAEECGSYLRSISDIMLKCCESWTNSLLCIAKLENQAPDEYPELVTSPVVSDFQCGPSSTQSTECRNGDNADARKGEAAGDRNWIRGSELNPVDALSFTCIRT